MAKIGLVHPDLNKKGGAESVAINIMNALQPAHEVDLITLTVPKESKLEEYYDVPVSINETYTKGTLGPRFEETTSQLSQAVGIGNFGALDTALINRIARSFERNYDLMLSSMSEMSFNGPSIQYIHYPNFYRREIEEGGSALTTLYETVCSKLSRAESIPQTNTKYIANSEWTAKRFEEIYGCRPKVIHPPVDTSEFDPTPWEKRKEGILVVGRIAKDKRIAGILDVFSSLQSNGYTGKLHILGPIHDEQYMKNLRQNAGTIPDVNFHGPVSRAKLTTMMSDYKYGIHAKEKEHFGMVVAEYVAAGMIPFVPNSGGQQEIVDHNSMLVYDSWNTLDSDIETVISNSDMQADMKEKLSEKSTTFSQHRFQSKIANFVDQEITGKSE